MINKNRLINFFEKIVKIDSPSKEEKEIMAFLRAYLEDLGFKCHEDHAAEKSGGNANNLYGVLKGDPNHKSICFNAHTDTVKSTKDIKIINNGKTIKSDGNTILGADDKAGVAIIIEAIQSIIENKTPHGDIYVLFTVQEEIGVSGAEMIETEGFNPDYCFSFDTTVPVITLVAGAPTHFIMKYKIHGKSAHAAYAENSVNSIFVAASAISKLQTGILDEDSCCNFGKITGGERFNIVPDYCEVWVECRSRNNDKANQLEQKITKTFEEECEKAGATLEKEVRCGYRAFNIEKDDPQFVLARNTALEMGIEPEIEYSLGGYDASIFNEKGLKTMVSSTGYDKMHTTEEVLDIDQFVLACEYAYKLIENV